MDVVQRIADLASTGIFGEGTFVEVDDGSNEGKGAQYASAIHFLVVKLSTEGGDIKEVPIVVKTQVVASAMDFMGTHMQFTSEVVAYNKILPSLGANELGIIPKMYYGLASSGKDPMNDIIILEDMRPKGFGVLKETFLDLDTISKTLRRLGEFHGLSYRSKRSSPENHRKLIEEVPPTMIVDCEHLVKGGVERGFKPLLERHPNNPIVKKAYDKLSRKPMVELWDTLSKPEEPFAVIAHGDFNKNNIMHSLDENGKVKEVMFFDFGTLGYLDPVPDISFFLYMNMSSETRENHWDDLLATYWEGVTSVESNPGFGFNDFLNNFKNKAVFGFLPCSYYLPMVLYPEEAEIGPEKFLTMTNEDHLNCAGEKGDSVVSSIIQHLFEKGYFDELDYL